MQIHLHPSYDQLKVTLLDAMSNFDHLGEVLHDGRNTVKVITLNGFQYNFKRFKKPNLINKVAYRFFRKSKARRSFEYANILMDKGIGTPQPVAFLEQQQALSLGSSFYISKQLHADFTFRELINDETIVEKASILRAYATFLFNMHEAGVYFMDNSPGNTLITQTNNGYEFALVDLNRMKFYNIPWQDRLRNFERLSPQKWMYEIMGDEYSKLSRKQNSKETIAQMWQYTQDFQHRFHRKKAIKKKLKTIFKS